MLSARLNGQESSGPVLQGAEMRRKLSAVYGGSADTTPWCRWRSRSFPNGTSV
jgi:hypothetical protein